MSDVSTKKTTLGKANDHWGVCGFTSVLYAIYTFDKSDARIRKLHASSELQQVAITIKDYLTKLQMTAEGEAILSKIQKFTQSFGGYEKFSVRGYTNDVKTIIASNNVNDKSNMSIGMPPEAVMDLLKREHNITSDFEYVSKIDISSTNGKKMIVGVRNAREAVGTKMYRGLVHWVYFGKHSVYSWGEKFASLADLNARMNKSYEVCCTISLRS